MTTPNTPESRPATTAVQAIYVNGFGIGLGNSDVSVMLQHNGTDRLHLNLSYTVAKTLGQELTRIIERLEKATGQPILTSAEILSLLEKAEKPQ